MTSHPADWELLQALLGLAFTIQQEVPKPLAHVDAPAASAQHPSLERIATFARNLTEATGAAIALGDANGMVCVARSGASAPALGAAFNISDGLSGECIRWAQPVVCVNAAADPRVNYQACRALNVASLLYLPLYAPQGNLIGLLGVFSSETLHFSQRDISCLRVTERLVQEALGSRAENPDVASLAALLRQGGIDVVEKSESAETNKPANEFYVPLDSKPQPAVSAPVTTQLGMELPTFSLQPTPRADAKFVGTVVDDSVAELDKPPADPPGRDDKSEGRSRVPVLLLVLLIVLVIGTIYKYRPKAQSPDVPPDVSQNQNGGTKESETPAAPVALLSSETAMPAARKLTDTVTMMPMENGASIHIDLPRPIRYEGYQLDHPNRIYFDLHDVRLSDDKGTELKSADGLVSGVRLFTYSNGVTRIVFDLRHPATFAAKLDENPSCLKIELKSADGGSSKISEAHSLTKSDPHSGAN